jgi:hypothetical protein
VTNEDFDEARQRVAAALGAMGHGDPEPYAQCWADSADATLLGAWGPIERGHPAVTKTFEWVGSRFSGGPLVPTDEVVHVHGDLAHRPPARRLPTPRRTAQPDRALVITSSLVSGARGWWLRHIGVRTFWGASPSTAT